MLKAVRSRHSFLWSARHGCTPDLVGVEYRDGKCQRLVRVIRAGVVLLQRASFWIVGDGGRRESWIGEISLLIVGVGFLL